MTDTTTITTTITAAQCEDLYRELGKAKAHRAQTYHEWCQKCTEHGEGSEEAWAANNTHRAAEGAKRTVEYTLSELIRPAIEPLRRNVPSVLHFGRWSLRATRIPGSGKGCYTLAAVELWCYDGEHEEFVAVATEEDHTANNEAESEWYTHVG